MGVSRIGMVVAVVLGFGVFAMAAEKKKEAMSPEMAAMMEKAKTLGAPGVNHQALTPLAGNWTATGRSWMKPGDKPMESQGTSNNSWVFENRFLKQEFKGNWAGQPFEGMGYVGYDNIRGEYESIWLDNMMTGIVKLTVTYDPASKALTFTGTFSCPVTGDKNHMMKAEWKIIDNDKNVYTAWDKTPDGKEFKSMEITYKRVK